MKCPSQRFAGFLDASRSRGIRNDICEGQWKPDAAGLLKHQDVLVDIQQRLAASTTQENTQVRLDMYWRLYYYIQINHPWLELVPDVRFFKVSPRDVFSVNSLVDIGHEIRCMVMHNNTRSTLFDLIEYSLPYVKHNRLHLPNVDRIEFSVLCQIVQIMLATCIGTFSHSTRRPIWECRVRLLAFFDDLLSNRTKQDLWEFCNDNILIMRISLIEYFVYFVKNQMPAEHETMRMSFETTSA